MSKFQTRGITPCHLPYSVSQNFLTSRALISRLLKMTSITKEDTVLEIGAGKGHITKALSDSCKTVISYEIDRKLYETLRPQLADNVRLYHKDFLSCRLPSEPYLVFANIPYSRTTDIVRKLTNARPLPNAIWLVMEKGAAKRFCGLPKDSLQSLLIKPFFETKIIYHFKREDFHPAPRVDSVLVEWKRKELPDIHPTQKREFSAFLSHSLRYGLFGSRSLLTKKQIATALRLAGLPPIERSGNVLYVQWLCLFRCWLQYGKKK